MAAARKKKVSKKKAANKTSKSVIRLEKRVVIGKIDDLKATLEGSLETPDVHFDAADVEAVDTASLQLLLAFINARSSNDLGVTWDSTSGEFVERAALVGMHTLLGVSGNDASGVTAS